MKYLTMMLLLGFLTLSQISSARHLQDEVAVTTSTSSASSTHDALNTTYTEHGDGWYYYYDTANTTSNVDHPEDEEDQGPQSFRFMTHKKNKTSPVFTGAVNFKGLNKTVNFTVSYYDNVNLFSSTDCPDEVCPY